MTIRCQNCESLMDEEQPCPECDHVDGDINCQCRSCDENREQQAEEAELRLNVQNNNERQ